MYHTIVVITRRWPCSQGSGSTISVFIFAPQPVDLCWLFCQQLDGHLEQYVTYSIIRLHVKLPDHSQGTSLVNTSPIYDVTDVTADQIGAAYSSIEVMTFESSLRQFWIEPPMLGIILARALLSCFQFEGVIPGVDQDTQVFKIFLLVTRTALILWFLSCRPVLDDNLRRIVALAFFCPLRDCLQVLMSLTISTFWKPMVFVFATIGYFITASNMLLWSRRSSTELWATPVLML